MSAKATTDEVTIIPVSHGNRYRENRERKKVRDRYDLRFTFFFEVQQKYSVAESGVGVFCKQFRRLRLSFVCICFRKDCFFFNFIFLLLLDDALTIQTECKDQLFYYALFFFSQRKEFIIFQNRKNRKYHALSAQPSVSVRRLVNNLRVGRLSLFPKLTS